MSAKRHSAEDEDAFMLALLQNIDASAPEKVIKTPKKTKSIRASGPSPSKVFSAGNVDSDSLLEGLDDWDWDIGSDLGSPKKTSSLSVKKISPTLPTQQERTRPQCTRCVVEKISEMNINGKWQKDLLVRLDPGNERRQVTLRDDWISTNIHIGDIINVLGTFIALPSPSSSTSPTATITLTAQENLLIHHPDVLITATALSSAPSCARKPLISLLLRSASGSDDSPALVWGNILHEVMQRCLLTQCWDSGWIQTKIGEVVRENIMDLVKIGVSVEEAEKEVGKRAAGLKVFGEKYIGQKPKPTATLTNTRTIPGQASSRLAITDILDVEEDIWSPTYGLKGKLDATVLGVIEDPPPPNSQKLQARSASQYVPSSLPSTVQRSVFMNRSTSTSFSSSKTVSSLRLSSSHPNLFTSSSSTSQLNMPSISSSARMPLPLELKTGRATDTTIHRAQTLLYTLLVSERYGTPFPVTRETEIATKNPTTVPTPRGLLFYTQSEEVVCVPAAWNEIRGLIGVRNLLAGYLIQRDGSKRVLRQEEDMEQEQADSSVNEAVEIEDAAASFLPPPIDDERLCSRCYVLDACMLYRKAYTPKPPPSYMIPTYNLKTGHLTSEHAAFFKKWETLIALEEADVGRFKRELWVMGAKDRERRGRCWGGMRIDEKYVAVSQAGGSNVLIEKGNQPQSSQGEWGRYGGGRDGKIHKFTYRFLRGAGLGISSPTPGTTANTLLSGHIGVGDAVTVSVEPHLLALARGFVLEIAPASVVLGVDHILDVEGIGKRVRGWGREANPSTYEDRDGYQIVFRIDKDELSGGMGRVRDNLAQLFYAESDTRRRALVVDLVPPVFNGDNHGSDSMAKEERSTDDLSSDSHIEAEIQHLNANQRDALYKVLSADDYALVLGMPGTGKTTLVAALIRVLVRQGKTVLLSSYTHSAVDTIVRKLDLEGLVSGRDEGVLRLGNVDKVHPDVRKYTLAAKRKAVSVEDLEAQIMRPKVVATTCLSVDHALFSRRRFDYCIVDEASQITLPTCLGPLRFAKRFVLVGDHFQLPPLVRNRAARKGGLDVSLFRRLSDAHPQAVVDLAYQYRMNSEIMLLSNCLIYDDRLKCGSDEVAQRSLKLRDRSFLERIHPNENSPECGGKRHCWIERLVDERCKAVFVDTDLLPAPDSRVGDLVQNETEAELVRQLTETLLHCGVCEEQIGIISLYRQQVKLLTQLLQERAGVEILTADRSQGRDKDCIIISLVRSNDAGQIGDLVKDWRRMNVSFTRARAKLVIIGSRRTLQGTPLLAQFFELMDKQGWVLQLPPGAHMFHHKAFDANETTTPKKRSASSTEENQIEKENTRRPKGEERPMKKTRLTSMSMATKGGLVDSGLLRGRPILRELLHDNMDITDT